MKGRILVIEDNEQNLYLVRYILEDCGYEVFAALDGREGIELAGSLLPDLILLDIQLPTMGRLCGCAAPQEQCSPGRNAHRGRDVLCHGRRPGEGDGGGLQRLYRKTHRSGHVYVPGGRVPPPKKRRLNR